MPRPGTSLEGHAALLCGVLRNFFMLILYSRIINPCAIGKLSVGMREIVTALPEEPLHRKSRENGNLSGTRKKEERIVS